MSQLETPLAGEFDRLPPHSIDTEKCLLNSMMLEKDIISEVRAIVPRDAFYSPDHQIIFDAVNTVYDRTGVIDGKLVREELISRQMLEEIGGVAYLGDILNSAPSAAHAMQYADIVRDRWLLRRGIDFANQVLRHSYQPHRDNSAAEYLLNIAGKFADAGTMAGRDGFVDITSLMSTAYENSSKNGKRFYPTGLRTLDHFIGGIPIGGTTVIGARPGMGKSQLTRQIMFQLAVRGVPSAIISIEEQGEKIGANILSASSGVTNSDIVFGRVTGDENFKAMADGLAWASGKPLYVNDKPAKLNEVIAAITLAATKYKCRAVAVDYLQLIDAGAGSESKNVEVTNISRAIKSAFKRFNLAGIVAAQLSRKNEAGEVRHPRASDLRDSGSIEQDGDLILMLHNDDYYHRNEDGYIEKNKLEIIIAKNKSGQTGCVNAHWSGDTQTVSEWSAP